MNRDRIRVTLVLSRRQLTAALALIVMFGVAGALRSETLTLSAIYPSPSGLYKKLLITADAVLSRDSGTVKIGSAAGTQKKLEVFGRIRMNDGTQMNGKTLISDADGVARWEYLTYAP